MDHGEWADPAPYQGRGGVERCEVGSRYGGRAKVPILHKTLGHPHIRQYLGFLPPTGKLAQTWKRDNTIVKETTLSPLRVRGLGSRCSGFTLLQLFKALGGYRRWLLERHHPVGCAGHCDNGDLMGLA